MVLEVLTRSEGGAGEVQQDIKAAASELETQTIDGYGAMELQQVDDTDKG